MARVSYDHAASRWGVPDFLVCGLIFIGVSIGIVLVIVQLSGSDDAPTGPWLLAAIAIPPLAELAYVVWVATKKGRGLAPDFRFDLQRGDVRLGVNLFGMAILSAFVIVAIWSAFGEPPTATATDLAQESTDSLTIWIVLFAIAGATLIPVIEELVFRGLLWSALEKRGHRPLVILLVTSAIFSLFHLEPTRSPILFVIGLVIGIGRLRTGRIGASIITHIIINSLAMTFLITELA